MIGLSLATLLLFSHPSQRTASHSVALQPFAIDYGWIPRQHHHLVAYAKLLNGYRVVVLGSGDENLKNGEIPSIRELQKMLPTTKWYGYISIGVNHGEPNYSYSGIEKRIQEWKQLHVNGILLDCAGPSYGTSQARRAWAMNAVHLAGMHIVMNAFTPSVLFSLKPLQGDAWLAENWVISNGKPTGSQGQEWWALSKMKQRGWQVWATATGASFPTNKKDIRDWVVETDKKIHPAMISISGPNYASVTNRLVPASELELRKEGGNKHSVDYWQHP